MKRILIIGALLLPLLGFAAYTATPPSNAEVAVLKVESLDADAEIFFEATFGGDTPDQFGRLERQETPFEMEIDAESFHGLFRQLDGEGKMRITLSAPGASLESNGSVSFMMKRGGKLFTTQL